MLHVGSFADSSVALQADDTEVSDVTDREASSQVVLGGS